MTFYLQSLQSDCGENILAHANFDAKESHFFHFYLMACSVAGSNHLRNFSKRRGVFARFETI
jgi:hypothetical protein